MTTSTGSIVDTMVQQIGSGNILAVSGGRWFRISDTEIHLPVTYGYRVSVKYDLGSDSYIVSRSYVRGSKVFDKGSVSNVYFTELGDKVYKASCYESYDENEWMTA